MLDDPELHFSADPDAQWVKKGQRALWVTRALPAPTKGLPGSHNTCQRGRKPGFATMMMSQARRRQTRLTPAQPTATCFAAVTATASCARRAGPRLSGPLDFGKALQQADLEASFPRRALLRQHEASLGSVFLAFIVHDILDWPKHTPTNNSRERTEPAQGREQNQNQPASPGNRITKPPALSRPLSRQRAKHKWANRRECEKSSVTQMFLSFVHKNFNLKILNLK